MKTAYFQNYEEPKISQKKMSEETEKASVSEWGAQRKNARQDAVTTKPQRFQIKLSFLKDI